MKESKTAYSYLIEHMQTPSFQKIWDIAFDFVRKLPSELCDELHESLNRGVDILDSESLLQMYIYAFGKMHDAKLRYAFNQLQERIVKNNQIVIVDYGCGQGLASICYRDFILEHNPEQKIKKIVLIEPSPIALSRAELLCSSFYPNTDIVAVNKFFDDLSVEDLGNTSDDLTLHLFSNILDVESYDLNHLARIVKSTSSTNSEYVIVSPIQNETRINRLKTFVSSINGLVYYENYLEKRQLDKDRDWTCAVLLCTNTTHNNVFESDYEQVFEEAKTYFENVDDNHDETYGKALFYRLQSCAERGDKKCQNQLGIWYLYGIETEQNTLLALEWLKKSAEQNYASAICNLGNIYYEGEFVSQDYAKAIEYYTIGSDNNYAICQYELGACYFKGTGVEKNYNTAFSFFNKAAEQGYDRAIYNLWVCYINGYGTEKNEKYAIELLKKAVKLNDPRALFKMAKLYQTGKLVIVNERKALGLFKKAAKLGYIKAQEKLGEIYKSGLLGEEESPKKAFKWFLEAAEQGSSTAQFYVGLFYANGYGIKKDDNLAFEWYSKAALQNSPSALNNLAVCFEHGKGTPIDLAKAACYYEKSARLGNLTAQKNLARCYQNGTGVSSDPNKVFFWTQEAAKRHDLESQEKLALLCFKGYGTTRCHEEALIWYARFFSGGDQNNNINNVNSAFGYVKEKAEEGDARALYIIGKCLQYGVALDKNNREARDCYEKAAELGHVESMIKIGRLSSLFNLCSINDDKNVIVDAWGVKYSKDKKILISSGYQNIKEYKIAKGTRVICSGAFDCGVIEKIVIPSTVVAIGKNPFAKKGWGKCGLTTIECFSSSYATLDSALYTKDKKRLISYFGNVSKFTIPKGVETIGEYAFYQNENLAEIEFNNDLCSIEEGAFSYCSSLQNITLPSSVISIGSECFYGCESLSEVLSLGNISVIKEGTFMGCGISKLMLPKSLVEIEKNAFNSNHKLTEVVLPNSLEKLGNCCFAYCGIKKIILSDNLREIGDFCFFECEICSILIPSQVVKIGKNPFVGVKQIKCAKNGKYKSENGLVYNSENGDLVSHYDEKEIALYSPIKRINSYAFYKSDITDVFMGENVVEVEPYAFYEAQHLEKVLWQRSRIMEIPLGCFGECSSLLKLDIPVTVKKVCEGSLFHCFGLNTIRFLGAETKVVKEMFLIKRPTGLPVRYSSPYILSGSSITEGYIRGEVDTTQFKTIELIVPKGSSDNYRLTAIYDTHVGGSVRGCVVCGYDMDRNFLIREDGNN